MWQKDYGETVAEWWTDRGFCRRQKAACHRSDPNVQLRQIQFLQLWLDARHQADYLRKSVTVPIYALLVAVLSVII